MKKSLRFVLSILLFIICVLCIAACTNKKVASAKKITEAEIAGKLADYEGALTITEGNAEDINAFEYVLSNVQARYLIDKEYTRTTVYSMLNSGGNFDDITIAQVGMFETFGAVQAIVGLFYEATENFNSIEYIEEVLTIICDGNSRQYNGWTISVSIDQEANSLKVNATSK